MSQTEDRTAAMAYTNEDYKLRQAVADFVLDSKLTTCAAIREIRTKNLATSDFARKTLNDLGSKMNTVGLSTPQIELARNILRDHMNALIRLYGPEVKAKMQKAEAAALRKENTANTLAVAEATPATVVPF